MARRYRPPADAVRVAAIQTLAMQRPAAIARRHVPDRLDGTASHRIGVRTTPASREQRASRACQAASAVLHHPRSPARCRLRPPCRAVDKLVRRRRLSAVGPPSSSPMLPHGAPADRRCVRREVARPRRRCRRRHSIVADAGHYAGCRGLRTTGGDGDGQPLPRSARISAEASMRSRRRRASSSSCRLAAPRGAPASPRRRGRMSCAVYGCGDAADLAGRGHEIVSFASPATHTETNTFASIPPAISSSRRPASSARAATARTCRCSARRSRCGAAAPRPRAGRWSRACAPSPCRPARR